jgi:hypothetical protein
MATWTCRIASSRGTAAILRHLDALGIVAADHYVTVGDAIQVTLTDREIATLEAHGIVVKRGKPLLTRAERHDVGKADGSGMDLASGFVTGYLDGVEVAARVTALATAYPTWCTVITLPFLTTGYDGSLVSAAGPAAVLALRITANPAVRSKPGFLLISGTHAREWMNPLIALEFAEQLLANVDPASVDPPIVAITRIVTDGDVLIVPALNPDGLTYSVHDDAGWRKNRRPNAGSPGCPGVDDNRNYEVYFGGAGSSAAPCSDGYHGPASFSEADTRNVRWLLEEFPNILVGVDAHSYGQQILRPGPAGGSYISSLPVSAADHAIYTGLETTLQIAIASANGVSYSTGSTSNHAGTSDEYMFFAHRVFGFNTECGTDFQPPWSEAVPVIDEVVTGLRALAVATLDLTTTTTVPLQVAQCIDRTGSMVAFGYDASARANAKRFVDLMSLGDSTGIVTFADPAADPKTTPVADRSRVEFPLTLLDDPGDAATARAAIDGIAFGGWTPIGAGLQRSATMLAAAPAPRAILLLSDGFENRDPTAASILATWPANLRVFAVALGPAADTALLQQIATQTGGIFQASSTALDLHQIYNQMRADIMDDGMILNRAVAAGDGETEHDADVEPAVDRLTVTVSSADRRPPRIYIVAPSGRAVSPDNQGVRTTLGEGYVVVSIDRPVPGRWRVRVQKQRSAHVVAAFVTSPLRTRIHLPEHPKPRAEVEVTVRACFDGASLGPVRTRARTRALPTVSLQKDLEHAAEPGWSDRLPRGALASIGVVTPGITTNWASGKVSVPSGLSRIEIEVQGQLSGGATFRRVALRTLRA